MVEKNLEDSKLNEHENIWAIEHLTDRDMLTRFIEEDRKCDSTLQNLGF